MRKNSKGFIQFTVYIDPEDAEYILRFSNMECRSPENAIRYLLKKKIKEVRGEK